MWVWFLVVGVEELELSRGLIFSEEFGGHYPDIGLHVM